METAIKRQLKLNSVLMVVIIISLSVIINLQTLSAFSTLN